MRYLRALAPAAERLEEWERTGLHLVVTAPGEAPAVAAALLRLCPTLVPTDLAVAASDAAPARALVVGLPASPELALQALNARRNRLSSQGLQVVLVFDRSDAGLYTRHAPDAWSGGGDFNFVAFEPDPAVQAEPAAAALRAHNRARWGQLDLRGFVRSEAEDSHFSVEQVFEELYGTLQDANSRHPSRWTVPLRDLVGADSPAGDRLLLVGGPGSGKTFFLRWLAVRPSPTTRVLTVLLPAQALADGSGAGDLLTRVRDLLLADGLQAGHVVEAAAQDGSLSLLIDGLDEVGDLTVQAALMAELDALAASLPRCAFLATVREAGFDPRDLSAFTAVRVEPLRPPAIRRFLERWCVLQAVERKGDTEPVRRRARTEGDRLADDVLAKPELARLAATPLLLTVLALVHRAGVRLPDHRVELYGHISRVLVERWNRVRSLAPADTGHPPLRLADAVRLLGPVALVSIEGGGRGAISTEELRARLGDALERGRLRSVGSADQALRLFRQQLGLLVEVGPDRWSFAHLTLAEHFAALELVRSGGLEVVLSDGNRAFQPALREVLLLAAGELGVIQAADERLADLVATLLDQAASRPGRPSAAVPSLLGGLLADDPHLRPDQAQLLVDFLIPACWFDRGYGRQALPAVIDEGTGLLRHRILGGAHGDRVRRALEQHYGGPPSAALLSNLRRAGQNQLVRLLRALVVAGVDLEPLLRALIADSALRRKLDGARWLRVRVQSRSDSGVEVELPLPRGLQALLAEGGVGIEVHLRSLKGEEGRPPLRGSWVTQPDAWEAIEGGLRTRLGLSERDRDRVAPDEGVAGLRLAGG